MYRMRTVLYGFPGYVWVTETEIEEIAKTLNISVEECMKKYVRRLGDRYSLRELPKTYACVFLEGKKCSIYHARPKQCRPFPWWPENISTRQEWHEIAERCEGIGHPDAPVVAFGEIQKQLQIHTTEEEVES